MSEAPLVRRRKQHGVMMVALMAGIAIALILSTVAVQSWEDVIRRDNEAEMMFRAQDIVRALKRYQTDKGKLPVELKELIEPGNKQQYFLRQLWKDPLVKGGQWQFVYLSPTGGLFDPSVENAPQPGDPSSTGLQPSRSLLNPTETGAVPGMPGGSSGDPTGLPIAGVKTRCKDRPFRRYKDKTEYSDWVFSIFDLDPRGAGAPQQGQQNQQNQQNQLNPQNNNEAQFPPTDK